ncbi:unnamed protein product [Ceutorhynchus assimilis]|uniref:Chitin-binding type-2 domain-containing protein n=1 Tax=Ceutorhynchus assimilis TaxID=467358 RepID=A0A9P0GPC7_9CUCU|nr:unnamed protein product [Ceutorhynchus assimilis]
MKLTIAIVVLSSLVALALCQDIAIESYNSTTSTKTTSPTVTTTTTKPTPTTTTTKPNTTRPCLKGCKWNIYLSDYNCSRFWQCADGVATLQECPCDLHFNPEANVCDWPKNFKHDVPCKGWTWEDQICEAPETTTEPTTLYPLYPPPCDKDCPYLLHVPDATSCKYFWKCDHGRAYRIKCPDGLVFNPETKLCDYNGCEEGRGWTWEDLICHDISTEKPCCEETTPAESEEEKPCCPVACPVQLFVPDPNCCNYWDCTNGVATKMTCPSGLWWNPEENICDWPNSDYCNRTKWDDSKLECPPSANTTTGGPSNTTPKPPKCEPGVEYIANLHDCGSYWQCRDLTAILMPCPKGLHWNSQKNYCDHPENCDCIQPS